MTDRTLRQICEEHVGKASDKWSIYIDEYERILSPYRQTPIQLLEIGVQNGGSLEIWSKYFPNAQKLIGCDIDPKCASLTFENPCIAVVNGDASAAETQSEVLKHAQAFDVILDDGSHRSSDIVRTFARYFPYLSDGGVFVAEDLHCSYWESYEGGLFSPFSSIAFFKRLADVISIEHWGIEKSSLDIFSGIFSKYGVQIEEEVLQHVHSVEFINSMCIVRKSKPENNRLGNRMIAGAVETIQSSNVFAARSVPTLSAASVADCVDQSGNVWAGRTMPPDEELLLRIQELSEVEAQIASLRQAISDRESNIGALHDAVMVHERQIVDMRQAILDREGDIARLRESISDRDRQNAGLRQALSNRDSEIIGLNRSVQQFVNSSSWRITKPVRFFAHQFRRFSRSLAFFNRLLTTPVRPVLRFLGRETRAPKILTIGTIRCALEGKSGKAIQFIKDSTVVSGWAINLEAHSAVRMRAVVGNRVFALCPKSREDVRRVFSSQFELPLDTGFAGVLSLPIGIHRMQIDVEAGGTWTSVHRATLLRMPQLRRTQPVFDGDLRFSANKQLDAFVNVVEDSIVVSGWAVDLATHSAVKVRVVVGKTVHHTHLKQRIDVQHTFATRGSLPLETGFACVLKLPIGLHRMRIEIEQSDGTWIPAFYARLLRIPKLFARRRTEGISYAAWMRLQQKRLTAEIPDITRHIDLMVDKPSFTIIVDTRFGSVGLSSTFQSIQNQLYTNYEVRVLAGSGVRFPSIKYHAERLEDTSLSDIRGDFILLIESGQRLAVNALYEFAAAINQYPDIDMIYGDEDLRASSGRKCVPFHKPGWSPDYLETFNYIGFPACFRTSKARECFENAHAYDLVLRFTESTAKILHIAKILGHSVENHDPGRAVLDIEALTGRLSRTGRSGLVREHATHKGCFDIRLDLQHTPLVSIVIPTAGKTVLSGGTPVDLLENVIRQIRNFSTYKNLEIIIVDNGDLARSQLDMLEKTGCRRITYHDPVFNIAKKLNLGVSIATGDMLLMMNDDIEIITPSWIERLLEHFEKPHVGVVGAKLLYPDRQTQHVGVVHNSGNPDHVRRLFPSGESGYFFSTCGVRNYSAVTGACMMTPTAIYREVGGYSTELAVSYNDADYCLKVRQKGLWVVYAPGAELIHMESQSRVATEDPEASAWYHRRWAPEIVSDEFYNERFLTVASPTFVPFINQRML